MEEGRWTASEQGSPQGATVSPLLANIYLHYVFDLWVQQWRKRHARGDVIVVRYADDLLVGFQHKPDAVKFLDAMRDRFQRFALALHPDKTRLLGPGWVDAFRTGAIGGLVPPKSRVERRIATVRHRKFVPPTKHGSHPSRGGAAVPPPA